MSVHKGHHPILAFQRNAWCLLACPLLATAVALIWVVVCR